MDNAIIHPRDDSGLHQGMDSGDGWDRRYRKRGANDDSKVLGCTATKDCSAIYLSQRGSDHLKDLGF